MKNTVYTWIVPASFLMMLAGCQQANEGQKQATADAIYFNGDILTMEGDTARYAEAIAIDSGTIVFVGAQDEAMQMAGESTRQVDLQGKTLTPGFIDAHGHFAGYIAMAATANLLPPPYGEVTSIPKLQEVLRGYIEEKNIPSGVAVIGNGYDDAVMEENRHPTAEELDAVSTEHPIYILHTSGHIGIANTLYMKELGVNYNSPDPEGGTMVRNEQAKKLTGKMVENANANALLFMSKLMPPPPQNPSDAQRFAGVVNTEKIWFANGQTTICEGRAIPSQIALLQAANEKGFLKGDYIVLADYDTNKDSMDVLKPYYKKYDGHFKIGAMKMTFDGSPQGKSAWLTEPYLIPPDEEKPGFKGQPIYTHEAAYAGLKDILEHGMQVHIHCNGDAAIDEGMNLIDSLQQQGLVTEDMRITLVHSQVTRPDQVPRFKELNVIPSWFPTHTYLWGDWHINSVLGMERASHISPLGDGLKQDILFTIHHDAPVTPPDLITAMYAAVNRTTRSGEVLGADQRISPYEALKAITINAAYQWNEENEKGSLKAGKKADLVILNQNPLKVAPETIKDIKVMETIKDGEIVYKRD